MPERGSKTSTVPVVWATFGIFFGTIQMISCSDWWPWTKPGYITMTRRQSHNQWNGGIAAHPAHKKIRAQKSAGKVFASIFLESRRHPPHWLCSKGPNRQRGVLLISAGAIEGCFEEKTPRESHQGVVFLHDSTPAHRALTTQKKLAYQGFQCFDHPPYSSDLVPSDYHLFPGLKIQLKGRRFSSDAEAIAAAETWLDGQTSDFF